MHNWNKVKETKSSRLIFCRPHRHLINCIKIVPWHDFKWQLVWALIGFIHLLQGGSTSYGLCSGLSGLLLSSNYDRIFAWKWSQPTRTSPHKYEGELPSYIRLHSPASPPSTSSAIRTLTTCSCDLGLGHRVFQVLTERCHLRLELCHAVSNTWSQAMMVFNFCLAMTEIRSRWAVTLTFNWQINHGWGRVIPMASISGLSVLTEPGLQ